MNADCQDRLRHARSLLFVPGSRPDRFAKAAASDADAIVIDLEDAVAPHDKLQARKDVASWLERGGAGLVRINGPDTPWHDQDLDLITSFGCGVLIPKVSSAEDVAAVAARLPESTALLPILETARGILESARICATAGVTRIAFGNGDLASELGVRHDSHEALRHARSQVVLASAGTGLPPPMDGVTTDLHDDEAVRADTHHARTLGFTGKLCVHPRQVPIVHSVLSPSAEDIRWAEAVVGASLKGGVIVVDGSMIDRPLVDRAHRILAQASP